MDFSANNLQVLKSMPCSCIGMRRTIQTRAVSTVDSCSFQVQEMACMGSNRVENRACYDNPVLFITCRPVCSVLYFTENFFYYINIASFFSIARINLQKKRVLRLHCRLLSTAIHIDRC